MSYLSDVSLLLCPSCTRNLVIPQAIWGCFAPKISARIRWILRPGNHDSIHYTSYLISYNDILYYTIYFWYQYIYIFFIYKSYRWILPWLFCLAGCRNHWVAIPKTDPLEPRFARNQLTLVGMSKLYESQKEVVRKCESSGFRVAAWGKWRPCLHRKALKWSATELRPVRCGCWALAVRINHFT